MLCRSSRDRPVVGKLVALALALALQGEARADKATFWTLAISAVGQIAHGQLAAAVTTLERARAQRAVPELDALVGLAALAGGRAGDALKLLAGAAARSSDPQLHYWAGRAAYAAGQRGKARNYILRAVSAGGDQPYLRMAEALVSKGTGGPGAIDALLEVARRWANLADPRLYPTPTEAAVELLGALVADMPDSREVQRTQGYLYWQLGRVVQAQERFFRLLERREGDPDALQMLARCAARLGRPRDGLTLARSALAAAPDHAMAQGTYGELLLELGQAKAAVPFLRRAADARPTESRLLLLLGQACYESHDLRCAEAFFGYASRRDEGLGPAHLGLALVRQQLQDVKGSEEALERVYALDPLDPQAYELGAHAARLRGDHRLMQERLAAARLRRSSFERLRRSSDRARDDVVRLGEALTRCSCQPRCRVFDRRCARASARLRPLVRAFFRAHQALQAQRDGAARAALRVVLAGLDPRRLLGGDPCLAKRIIAYRGKRRVVPELMPFVMFEK